MTRFRPAPRPLMVAVEALRAELAPETVLARVQSSWPEIVGPGIAAQARPVAERAGVLTVSCSGAVWAQELDLMAPEILARLNSSLAGTALSRLRCVTGYEAGV